MYVTVNVISTQLYRLFLSTAYVCLTKHDLGFQECYLIIVESNRSIENSIKSSVLTFIVSLTLEEQKTFLTVEDQKTVICDKYSFPLLKSFSSGSQPFLARGTCKKIWRHN